jgi:hypothetical protein
MHSSIHINSKPMTNCPSCGEDYACPPIYHISCGHHTCQLCRYAVEVADDNVCTVCGTANVVVCTDTDTCLGKYDMKCISVNEDTICVLSAYDNGAITCVPIPSDV